MPIKKLSKYLFSKDHLVLICGLIPFLFAGTVNLKIEKPLIELSKQETALNINKDLLIFMSAGNKRLLTDLLWVQTLLESDVEHYARKDLNNWLFLRFNTISVLDPKFYENYLYGGQFLAIVKDDLEGAEYIYDKALKYYPNDYHLNYNAGFLNYYEIGNLEKGIKYLKKVEGNSKAPVFIKSIITKIQASTGTDLEEIFKMVLHNYETTQDEKLRAKLGRDLYAIRAEIDVTCLNDGKTGCALRDLNGVPYVKKNGKYEPVKSIIPYRIKTRQK